jgi:hypothetical protein
LSGGAGDDNPSGSANSLSRDEDASLATANLLGCTFAAKATLTVAHMLIAQGNRLPLPAAGGAVMPLADFGDIKGPAPCASITTGTATST